MMPAFAGRSGSPQECAGVSAGSGLDCGELPNPGSLTNNRHSRNVARHLFEQFEPLYADAKFEGGKTGSVASRMSQAINKSRTNRIGHPNEDDWHGVGRLLQG